MLAVSIAAGFSASAAEAPVVQWHFDGADALGSWTGSGHREGAGPRGPIYAGFASDNQAAEIAGKDAALMVADAPSLRFGKGDAITVEAWVKVRAIRDGQMVYLAGKGRNGSKEFGDNNQN